jgi:hypothetical protein
MQGFPLIKKAFIAADVSIVENSAGFSVCIVKQICQAIRDRDDIFVTAADGGVRVEN